MLIAGLLKRLRKSSRRCLILCQKTQAASGPTVASVCMGVLGSVPLSGLGRSEQVS